MKMSMLITGLNALCVQYTAHLKDAFWARTRARLEEIFSSESSFEDRRGAISESVKRAFNQEHWRFIVDCIGDNPLLLGREVYEEFFSECDPEVLETFVADENRGIVPTTLLALATSTSEVLKPESASLMHLALTGLNSLVERQGDWAEPRHNVTYVLEGFCVLLGGAPEHLQKRFDAILSGNDDGAGVVAQKTSALPTAPPRRVKPLPKSRGGESKDDLIGKKDLPLDPEAIAKAESLRGNSTYQPFAGLASGGTSLN